jgi:hypothetical protein
MGTYGGGGGGGGEIGGIEQLLREAAICFRYYAILHITRARAEYSI